MGSLLIWDGEKSPQTGTAMAMHRGDDAYCRRFEEAMQKLTSQRIANASADETDLLIYKHALDSHGLARTIPAYRNSLPEITPSFRQQR
jgi:hypothetical protein